MMVNFQHLAVDALAHPRLLSAREQARKVARWGDGVRTRALLAGTTDKYLPGLLSVVVPAYGVERFIDQCLKSLSVQNYRHIEVIVVDDGSPDSSYQIARRWSLKDPRIRVVRQENGGLSAARNTGVKHAHGEFLAFLDSDDFVDRHAYSDAMSMLEESGSDFALMPYRREKKSSFPPAAPWVQRAHATERMGVTLGEFPDALVNAVAWSKVYRREFWDRHAFEFPIGVLYEDQALSMAAFSKARKFDVLSRVSINWRIRDDQSSITQQTTSARNIYHHFVAVQDSLNTLAAAGALDARQERLIQVINNNLGEFLPNIRQMDDDAWIEFRRFLEYLVAQVTTEDEWNRIDARKKILLGLVIREKKDLALQFLEQQGWEVNHFPGTVDDSGTIRGTFPLEDELRNTLPSEAFTLSETETGLRAVARQLIDDGPRVRLPVIAYVDRIPPRDVDSVSFSLRNVDTGHSRKLDWHYGGDPQDALGHTRRYADMSEALFRVDIPRDAIASEGEKRIDVIFKIGAVVREAELSSGWNSEHGPVIEMDDGKTVRAFRDDDGALTIRTQNPDVVVRSAVIQGDTAEVSLISDTPLVSVGLVRDGDRFALLRERTTTELREGSWHARFKLPKSVAGGTGRLTYDLRAFADDGTTYTPYVPETVENKLSEGEATRYTWGRRVRARRTQNVRGVASTEFPRGGLVVIDRRECLVLTGASMTSTGELALECARTDATGVPVRATARVGSSEFDVPIVLAAGKVSIRVPLETSFWGNEARPIPRGKYSVLVTDVDGTRVSLDVDDAFASTMPQTFETDRLRLTLSRRSGAKLGFAVEPPIPRTEQGAGNRWRMKDWFYTLSPTGPPSVLFRNLYGEAANDSALAVHKELQRRESSLELIWAVKDWSVYVPDGATVVLEESKEYYEAFGTADYVMVNVHQPDWYRKPEGQVLIETFHGYPFKLNGRRWWDKLGFPAERQESFFKRAEEWDYLVSPAHYATEFLEEFYRPEADVGESILEIGYPRNDVLLSAESGPPRDDARKRLGIPSGKQAVLYAPTFRDYVSGDDMSASMVELLDVEKLMHDLGDEYVLLMRGHPFNARRGTKIREGIINVTDYPDINDLIVASDMAILDYSSLRFDYALTGKPAFFFVPDFEQYFDGRESFVPFETTAPGPLISDEPSLLTAMRNAPAVARKFDEQRREFVQSFMELEDGRAARRLVDRVFRREDLSAGDPEGK